MSTVIFKSIKNHQKAMLVRITVTPNPFTDQLEIEIEEENGVNGDLIISLTDQQGRILKMLGISLENGINKVELDKLDVLTAGAYYLDIKNTDGGVVFNASITKQ